MSRGLLKYSLTPGRGGAKLTGGVPGAGSGMGWPLVGRAEELAAASEALDAGGVVVAGGAGVGKTRLAVEVLDRARAQGWTTCWATATAAAQAIPFGALAHLLPASVGAGSSRANVLRLAADGFAREVGAAGDRVVLGIDDAHLLDEHSAALVQLLVASGRARGVATLRSGEPCPDAVVGLWKDGWCPRVELQPLSRPEVAELVEAVLGGPLDGPGLQRLWAACQGNCLVLHELVTGGLETGVLRQEGGLWRWRGGLVTARLSELVEARLDGLSPPQRQVVEVVAVAEPVGIAVLEGIAEPSAVEEVERRGLITEVSDDRRRVARLAHPVYGEVVRHGLAPAARRHVCGRLAAAVQSTGARRRGDLLQVATWRLEAADAGDPAVLVSAARSAVRLQDHGLAHRLAEAAADAGGGFDAQHLCAETLMGLGELDQADHVLARLQTEAETQAQRTLGAQSRALNLFVGLGRVGAGLGVLEAAEDEVTDPGLAAELAATRAYLLGMSGSLDHGIATATRVLTGTDLTERARTTAAAAAGAARLYGGEVRAGVQVLDDAEQRLRPDFLIARDFGFDVFRSLAALFSGHLVESAEAARVAYWQAIEDSAPPWAAGVWAANVGWALRLQGRPAQAVRWLDEAVGLFEEADSHGYLAVSLAELAHSHALRGRSDCAGEALRRAEAAWSPAMGWSTGFVAEARVWVAAAGGDVSAAIERAMAQADELGRMSLRVHQAAVLHQAARLGAGDRAGQPLDEVAGHCDAELVAGYQAHATALTAGDAAGLVEVSERFERMGALVYAAEAAAQAAAAWRHAGRRGSALTAAARARWLADQCQGTITPALVGLDGPLPLTPREREVAGLAARGLTNREIAGRLTVSVRTVHNQLTHVYRNLGIEGREQLAAILLPATVGEPSQAPEPM